MIRTGTCPWAAAASGVTDCACCYAEPDAANDDLHEASTSPGDALAQSSIVAAMRLAGQIY